MEREPFVEEHKMNRKNTGRTGFSLIELVIVVVIIAIIAAIAIPKMSRGASGAGDAALLQDLSVLRSAGDLYNAEHPGNPLGSTNSATATAIETSLTSYSDVTGATTSATKTSTAIYGPYLKSLPTLPVGVNKGQTHVTLTAQGTTA